MLEVMLFGKKTQEKCGNILKKQIPASLAAGKNYGNLPSSLLRQIARRDEFILLHRPEPEEYWCIFDASGGCYPYGPAQSSADADLRILSL